MDRGPAVRKSTRFLDKEVGQTRFSSYQAVEKGDADQIPFYRPITLDQVSF
jgi:hypothetical protein